MDYQPIVRVRNVNYTYPDGHVALREASLDVFAGEKVALTGANGAGKSTLLLQLNGILRGQGVIEIAGLALTDANLRTIRGLVGLVFQNPDDQLFSPTVFDDVAFGPLHMGLPEAEVRERTAWALDQVQMSAYAERMPHHLSLGERKKIAIATVLSMRPAILALDEPSAGLDPKARAGLIALLRNLPQAMLIATHDLEFAYLVCKRAIVMAEGRVVGHAQREEMLELERVVP